MGIAGLDRLAAVFLDRDGVLNATRTGSDGVPRPPESADALVVLPGVVDACLGLRGAGFRLIVVTNQPDVARGVQRPEIVEEINGALLSKVPVDEILVCYHDDADRCSCRKPKPGLLLEAAERWKIDLSRSFMVGDRWRDVEAGHNAGCRSVLIAEASWEQERCAPDYTASSFSIAAEWILAQNESRQEGRG